MLLASAVLVVWAVAVVAVHVHAAHVGHVPWYPKQGRPTYPSPSASQSWAAALEAVMLMACLPVSFFATLLVCGLSSGNRPERFLLMGVTALATAACVASVVLGFLGLRELLFYT
jgi:uncharacterized membrane protein YbhN (UPF0104 family)